MNEFSHRNESVASGISATDRVSAGRAVTPVPQTSRAEVSQGSISRPVTAPDAAEGHAPSTDETARAFATYSKAQTKIADVVADLGAEGARKGPADIASAEHSLLSLLPQPSVVLPLPPASEDMVAFVAQVARSIARQAAQTRAALSNVSAATVDAATA